MTTFSEEPDEDEYMEEAFSMPTVIELVNDVTTSQGLATEVEMEICMDEQNSYPIVYPIKFEQSLINQTEEASDTAISMRQNVKQETDESDITEVPLHQYQLPGTSTFPKTSDANLPTIEKQRTAEKRRENTPPPLPQNCANNVGAEGYVDSGFKSPLLNNPLKPSLQQFSVISQGKIPLRHEDCLGPHQQISLSVMGANIPTVPLASIAPKGSEETLTFRVIPNIATSFCGAGIVDQSLQSQQSTLTMATVPPVSQPTFSCVFTEESDDEGQEEIIQTSEGPHVDAQTIAVQKVQTLLQMFESGERVEDLEEPPCDQGIHNSTGRQESSFPPPVITVDGDDDEVDSAPRRIPIVNQAAPEVKLVFRSGSPPRFVPPFIPSRHFDYDKIYMVHPFITPFGRHIWPGVRIPVDSRTMVAIPKIPAEVLEIMQADDYHDSDFDDDMYKETFASRRLRKMRMREIVDTPGQKMEDASENLKRKREMDDERFVRNCKEQDRKETRQMLEVKRRIASPLLPLPQTRANNIGAEDYVELDAHASPCHSSPSTSAAGVIDVSKTDYDLPVSFSDKYSQHGVEPYGRKLDTWLNTRMTAKGQPPSSRTRVAPSQSVPRPPASCTSNDGPPPPFHTSTPSSSFRALGSQNVEKGKVLFFQRDVEHSINYDKRFIESGQMYQPPSTSQNFSKARFPNVGPQSLSILPTRRRNDYHDGREKFVMERNFYLDRQDDLAPLPPASRGSWNGSQRVNMLPTPNNFEPIYVPRGGVNRNSSNLRESRPPMTQDSLRFGHYPEKPTRQHSNCMDNSTWKHGNRDVQSSYNYDKDEWAPQPNVPNSQTRMKSMSPGHNQATYEASYRSDDVSRPDTDANLPLSHSTNSAQLIDYPPSRREYIATNKESFHKEAIHVPARKLNNSTSNLLAEVSNHKDDWDKAMETLEASLEFYSNAE